MLLCGECAAGLQLAEACTNLTTGPQPQGRPHKRIGERTASPGGSNLHLHCLQEDVISIVADAGSGTTQWGPAHSKHRLAASNLGRAAVGPSQLTSVNMSVGRAVTRWLQNGEQCCSSTGISQST